MAGSEREGRGFPTSGAVALVVVVVSAVLGQQFPLIPSRPALPDRVAARYVAVQNVEARLWQDPFEAIDRHRRETAEDSPRSVAVALTPDGKLTALAVPPGTSAAAFPDGHRHDPPLVGRTGPGQVMVLGVMVFGGRSVEDTEHRRRTRYAVVSGLNRASFAPLEEDRIGYFRPAESSQSSTLPVLIPFETFKDQSANQILVLWLDEGALVSTDETWTPAFGKIMTALDACSATSGPSAELRVIGPVSSRNLGLLWNKRSELKSCGQDIKFFPAMATAGIEKVSWPRLMATDDQLILELIRELKLRGADPACSRSSWSSVIERPLAWLRSRPAPPCDTSPGHIALISEWDTFYGRQLPEAFIAHVRKDCLLRGDRRVCARLDDPHESWIHQFSYLRGLDGIAGAPRGASTERPEKKESSKDNKPAQQIERAEQDPQLDYLRRLAARLREVHGSDPHPAEITAIGVLGSDVYDKLLVLQAVRREFPGKLFFTTDLDARLLHPAEYRAARNLIVASSFGLTLNHDLQGGIPPFRDTYQTATFLATLVALKDRTGGGIAVNVGDPTSVLLPRVFEIGRTEPFDLSRTCGKSDPSCLDVHPAPHRLFPRVGLKKMLILACGLIAAAILLYHASAGIQALVRGAAASFGRWYERAPRSLVMAVAITVSSIGPSVGALLTQGRDGEPFALAEGISLWPTELLRLVVLGLALGFLVIGRRKLETTTATLSDRFFRPSAAGDATIAEPLWQKHRERSRVWRRARRVAWSTFLYMVLGMSLGYVLGFPTVPYRGPVTYAVDRALLLACVIAVNVLIFSVVDAVRLCHRTLAALNEAQRAKNTAAFAQQSPLPLWPRATRVRFSDELGIDDAYVEPWITVNFIAEWTTALEWMVYWPFVAIALMIVARAPWFDDWSFPIVLVILFAVSLSYLGWCLYVLRSDAERARRESLQRLTSELIRLKGQPIAAKSPAAQVEAMIHDIDTLRGGALASLWQQPILRGASLVAGSVGGVTILDYLSLAGL